MYISNIPEKPKGKIDVSVEVDINCRIKVTT